MWLLLAVSCVDDRCLKAVNLTFGLGYLILRARLSWMIHLDKFFRDEANVDELGLDTSLICPIPRWRITVNLCVRTSWIDSDFVVAAWWRQQGRNSRLVHANLMEGYVNYYQVAHVLCINCLLNYNRRIPILLVQAVREAPASFPSRERGMVVVKKEHQHPLSFIHLTKLFAFEKTSQ